MSVHVTPAVLLLFTVAIGCRPQELHFSHPVAINDDGGWCWFEDPRAVVAGGRLVVGSVATGRFDSLRAGDIEATVVDLQTRETIRIELYDRLQADDHDSPVFLLRPDNRLLTLFSRHGNDNLLWYRVSEPDDWTAWGGVRSFAPSEATRLTYSNVFQLSEERGRIYNFFRGLDNSFKPSVMWSDDLGETWRTGGIVIDVPSTVRHRPYVRYASNGKDEVHMLYTEGHPRDFENSLYHIFYRDGALRSTEGSPVASLASSEGEESGLERPEMGTLIFQGDADKVAWCNDLALDRRGRPVAVYSVQVNGADLPPGQGGEDLRYRYARWDGRKWLDHPLAFAGTRLYAGEDDYAGLSTIHPHHPDIVFISTNADPVTGVPLVSSADGRRHYEIFMGRTRDGGAGWKWTAITANSMADNLRPIVPAWEAGKTIVLWLRGEYRSYTDYDLEVMMAVGE